MLLKGTPLYKWVLQIEKGLVRERILAIKEEQKQQLQVQENDHVIEHDALSFREVKRRPRSPSAPRFLGMQDHIPEFCVE